MTKTQKSQRSTKLRSYILVFMISFLFKGVSTIHASEIGRNESNVSQQQTIKITGVVVDAKGEPVLGATILEKGTSNGTVTDYDGKFTLETTANASVIVSYIGYKTQEIKSTSTMRIILQEDSELLEEVVIVGFGAMKKVNLTGAVANVDIEKTMGSRPIADVGRGLQGAIAGLSVVIPNGEVGSDPVIKIRGSVGSINGTTKPLILLDNVEIESIQLVNPDDIESISVLKDAASTSIYGAKGAFGVVLITSKKGANTESVNVQYSGNFSWQKVSRDINLGGIDALEYSLLAAERIGKSAVGAFWLVNRESFERSKEWLQQYGNSIGTGDPMKYGRDWYVDGSSKMGVRLYDAYDYMIDEWTPTQNHNLSVSGRSGKVAYNISLGHLDQSGMLKQAKHDDFRRDNVNIKLSSEINKNITVRAGMLWSKRTKRYPYVTNSTTADPWLYVYRWGPLSPFGTEDGDPLRSPASEIASANTARQNRNYTNINIGTTITITNDWTVDADYTYAAGEYVWDRPGTRYSARNAWSGAIAKYAADGSRIYVDKTGNVVDANAQGAMPAYEIPYVTYTGKGSNPDHIYRRTESTKQGTSNIYSTYNLKLADIHNFKFMAGMNLVTYQEKYNWSQKNELFDITNPQFDLAVGNQTSGGGTSWESQLGYFGRINYSLMDKYLLEANLRYDGSSKFPTGLKWRWFPSFSAGWIVSQESIMQSLNPVLSFLKLRGSWGTIGDQTVQNRLYVPIMTNLNTTWLSGETRYQGYATPLAADANISWQNIENLNLGLDARFFNDRLGVNFDWFQRKTKEMIVPGTELPYTFGGPVPSGNYGELRTRGWEISVDFNHRFESGLGINMMATLADDQTVITEYPEDAARNIIYTSSSSNTTTNYKGKEWGAIYGYKTDRLYQWDDFELDANGQLQEIVVNGKTVYKLKPGPDGKDPVYQGFLQNSSDFKFGPGDVKFVDVNGDGKIDNGNGTIEKPGDLVKIGNSSPKYQYGFRIGGDYKGFDLSVFLQGIGKREIWGEGFLAIPGFNSGDGAMPQTFAGDFWTEERTNAFYPRPYNNAGSNINNNLQVQSRYLLDMSYLRVKNITLGYSFNSNLIKKAYLSKARLYVSLENFFTFDNLNGLPIDPEVISGYSMFNESNYNSGRTGVGAPSFKSVSLGVQLNF